MLEFGARVHGFDVVVSAGLKGLLWYGVGRAMGAEVKITVKTVD